MATREQEGAVPEFLQMEATASPETAPSEPGGNWYGWPSKELKPVTLLDPQGRVMRVRAPVMDLEGLITPVELHYVVQHFDVPEVVPADQWTLTVGGEVKRPAEHQLRGAAALPGRSVRTVMECSGSDTSYFEYFKGEGARPSRTQEAMILSASEWTGVPLASVLNAAGLTDKAAYVRAEGWDQGVPGTAEPGTEPFCYDKGLVVEKPCTLILSWPGRRTASC